jgi:hypothetical protein
VLWHSDEIQVGTQMIAQDTARIKDYLNTGGKLWLIGLNHLTSLTGGGGAPKNRSYAAGTFERDYLGLSAANTNDKTDSSFVGTWAIAPGYVELATDSMKILSAWHGHLKDVHTLSPAGSEALLGYKSSPRNGQFEGLPCAMRYQSPTFKSVFFGFPGYQVQIDPVTGEPLTTVFRQTLTWLGN